MNITYLERRCAEITTEAKRWENGYKNACETNLKLIEENDALRDELKRVEAERLKMLAEIVALESRQQNCDRNRQFIDDATNWLGPFNKKLMRVFEDLESMRADVQQMHDAYYTVGGKYPWQDS